MVGQRCYVTNSETRGGGQARAIGENGANRPLMSFFHDSLHNKKKKSGSIRSNRSRGGGSYERARIKENNTDQREKSMSLMDLACGIIQWRAGIRLRDRWETSFVEQAKEGGGREGGDIYYESRTVT